MKPTRKLSRRSFLGRVAGGAIAGGAALTILTGPARAQGCSDSDSGPNGDPAGRGRRCGGCTDSDTGRYADGVGRGRRCGRTGLTDGDSGGNADPGGNGRGPRRTRDRANFGRGPHH